ncbi:hypothetical protein LBMAG09_11010 [Actinomycetes bacterium]|nr:hypothetical protein LBMAG09_11010 [Actinomycetes bacterium]
MDFFNLMSFVTDRNRIYERYEKIELDQKANTSRIRRDNQKIDEELYRIRAKDKDPKRSA